MTSGVQDNAQDTELMIVDHPDGTHEQCPTRSRGIHHQVFTQPDDANHESRYTQPDAMLTDIPEEPMHEKQTLDSLLQVFAGKLQPEEVISIYYLADDDFDMAMECLLEGPSLGGLLKLHNKKFDGKPLSKVVCGCE